MRTWTCLIDDEGRLVNGEDYGCVDGWEEVTIIEKSAYDAICAKHNECVTQETHQFTLKQAEKFMDERDQLKADNAKRLEENDNYFFDQRKKERLSEAEKKILIEALERIANDQQTAINRIYMLAVCDEYQSLAREALSKVGVKV